MTKPHFNRQTLIKMARVLGIESGGLSGTELLDRVHAELGRHKAAMTGDPSGVPPKRVELVEGGL